MTPGRRSLHTRLSQAPGCVQSCSLLLSSLSLVTYPFFKKHSVPNVNEMYGFTERDPVMGNERVGHLALLYRNFVEVVAHQVQHRVDVDHIRVHVYYSSHGYKNQ